MNAQDQSQEITAFLSKYILTQIDPQTMLIESPNANYLSKSIQLNREQADIDEVVESLDQHQTLSQNYLLTLINYQVVKSSNASHTVRTLYHYAKVNLQQEIAQRRQSNQCFSEQQLWAIIYSLTKSLEYLQKLGIAYGVLSCDKIFIDKKIKLLDPSAVGQDPFAIVPNRLYSPQVLNQHCSPDILKSDVFVLGLCVLQAALLLSHESLATDKYDDTRIKLYFQRFQAEYASELTSLIGQMLEYSPQNRPTFVQIREYLQNHFQMTDFSESYFNPLSPDLQDQPNHIQLNEFTDQVQVCDSEQQEEECCLMASLNQFQKARIRFLNEESPSELHQVSRIEESSRYSSSIRIQDKQLEPKRISLVGKKEQPFQKKRTSKQIKRKVVKDINSLQLQIAQVKSNKKSNQQNFCSQKNYNHIFTSPKLLQEIQNSLKSIAINRGRAKENVCHGNYQ